MGVLSFLKGKTNTLYYPGCLTKFVLKKEAENYRKILLHFNIDFIMLPTEFCCGSPILNAGYEGDAIKLARKNLKIFDEHNICRIITNCPACYKTFLDYNELLPDWDIEVEHVSSTILRELRKMNVQYSTRKTATYHDPCHLGRKSGIYDAPREILRLLGYKIIEMRNNKQEALCCGGGAGLKANFPELADKIAKKRIEQARDIGVDKIVTTCPLCFSHMQENSDIMIEEFSHVVADALGLKPGRTKLGEEQAELGEACN